MIEEYKSAMNRIEADDKFKAQLLGRLAAEQEKHESKKRRITPHTTHVVRGPRKKPMYVPIIASLSSAAVLALLIYSSTVLLLPMMRNNEYDMSTARPGVDYRGYHSGSAGGQNSDNYDIQNNPETPENDGTHIGAPGSANGNANVQSPGNADTTQADESSPSGDKKQIKPETQASDLNNVDVNEEYRIVSSYSAAASELKGASGASNTIDYNSVLHFDFDGFDEYGVGLRKNDIVFTATLDEDYTLSDLFTDYYSIIIGRKGTTTVNSGILDSFFDIPASPTRQISVYVNGAEIVNLDNVLLSEFSNSNDVYFTVSVT